MTKNKDEQFVMNFFQKGNNNKQIVNVQNLTQNFSESDYIPEESETTEEVIFEDEELTEIEKELDKDKKRLISEKICKKLTEKGYSTKTVGAFTFYIKTRAEYIKVLHQTLAFARGMAEGSVRDKEADKDFVEFITMAVLYLSDLLEKIETEEPEKE